MLSSVDLVDLTSIILIEDLRDACWDFYIFIIVRFDDIDFTMRHCPRPPRLKFEKVRKSILTHFVRTHPLVGVYDPIYPSRDRIQYSGNIPGIRISGT